MSPQKLKPAAPIKFQPKKPPTFESHFAKFLETQVTVNKFKNENF